MNKTENLADTKSCPYCFEPIRFEAIFCRWCKKSLKKNNWKTTFAILLGFAVAIFFGYWGFEQYQDYRADAEASEKLRIAKQEKVLEQQAIVMCARQLDEKIEAQKPDRKERERKYGKYYGAALDMELYGVRRVVGQYWPEITGTVFNAGPNRVVGSNVSAETYDSKGRVLEQPEDMTGVDELGSHKARVFNIKCMSSPDFKDFKMISIRGMQITPAGKKSCWGEYNPN